MPRREWTGIFIVIYPLVRFTLTYRYLIRKHHFSFCFFSWKNDKSMASTRQALDDIPNTFSSVEPGKRIQKIRNKKKNTARPSLIFCAVEYFMAMI